MKPLDGLPFPELETVVFSPWLELPLVRFSLIILIALFLVSFCVLLVALPKKHTARVFPSVADPWVRLTWDFSKSGSLKDFYTSALLTAKIPAPARAREILYADAQATEQDWKLFEDFFHSLQLQRWRNDGVE